MELEYRGDTLCVKIAAHLVQLKSTRAGAEDIARRVFAVSEAV